MSDILAQAKQWVRATEALERKIMHESGEYWVRDDGDCYTVYKAWITHSTQVDVSVYSHDADGLSIAIARCNYLATK